MNTKSKLKAISIGIAVIMMVSLLAAVTTVSASPGVIVTDCEIRDDNKVYFTIYSAAKADGHMCLNIDGEFEERKKYTLNAGETATLSFREYRWNGGDDVEVCVDCIDTSCCKPGDTQKPDLIVSDKWEESVNEQVIVHFIIENIGGGDAGASTACLEINGIYEGTVSVPALAAGESDVGEFAPEPCPPLTTITVTVCADNGYVVDESYEDNNCMTNEFTCPAKPDLVVIEMSEEPVRVDGQVIVHFVIENIGDAEAGESYATLYIDDMVVEIQNVLVPALGPNGGRFTGEFAAEDCTPGMTITVRVCADDTHMVDESDETNNCETSGFTCPIPPKPDLDVIEMSVEIPKGDGPVIVHFIIENIGDAEAGESYATLYIDDMVVEIQNVLVPALGPNGGRFTGEFAAEDCTEGTTITVRVCADDTHMVDESDENNNCETDEYTLTWPEPDLIVFSMSEEPTVDEQVIVHFVIQNVGNAEAGLSTAWLEINSVMIATASVPVLQPGISYGGAFAAQDCPPLTTINIMVCADNDDVVDESNEGNNCLVDQYTCPIRPKPDLVVENKWEEPVGGQVIVHFEIHNNGTANAVASFATLYIDDMLVKLQNAPVPELGPSGVFSGEFAAEDCTPGTAITVRVCADDTHVVEESDETNNCMTNVYTCAAKPDLVVIEKWEESVDGQVIVRFVVKNIGVADAGPSVACKKIDGVLKDTASVPKLAGGESHASAFDPEPCPLGQTINITVCADNYDAVDESNENNNCNGSDFTCPAKPDLVVIEKWEEPVNGQVIVHFVIQNNATVNAGESYATLYIDDMDQKIQNVYVPELGSSGTFSGEFAGEPCTEGTDITVKVCADDTHMVDESNETNNCMTNVYTCPILPKPDLVVNDTWEEAVKSDGHVIVHFIIENIGVADAGESYATLYIDNMLVETQNVLVPVIAPNGRFVGAFALELCPNDKDIEVKVCADDTKVVVESNETNNCRTNTFTCLSPGPDLEITKTVTTTISGIPNQFCPCNYTVAYTVTNNGDEIADWCCGNNNSVALFVDGVLELLDDNIPALGPGASWNGDFDWQSNCLGPATINFTVCADHYNVVDEGNESNNCEINIVPCGVEGTIAVNKWPDFNNVKLGDIVVFQGTVSNVGCCCCDLTDIYVNDTLPACLQFVTATPVGWAILPDGTISWHHNTLACGGDIDYTIDARLVDCCYDVGPFGPEGVNTMTANATTCRGNPVTSSSTATVYPDTTVRTDITKVVWNATSLTWGDSTNATNGTDVQFMCTIHNNGTCRNLSYIQVWDEMSDSLEYNWSTNVPYGVVPIEQTGPGGSTILYWEFTPAVILTPCEWLNFTINATVRNGTVGEIDTNTLRVRAWSEEWWTGAWASIFEIAPDVEVIRAP